MQAIMEKTILIRSTEVDFNNCCRPSAILGYLQEMAIEHAEELQMSRQYLLDNYHAVWLLVRLWFRLERPIRLGEQLTIRTWHRGPDRLYIYRDFDLLADGERVGEAVSLWVVADVENRRILRPGGVDNIVSSPVPETVKDRKLKLIHSPRELERIYEKTVRWSDVDLNGHMNNTRYADVAMDALTLEEMGKRFVSEFHMTYSQECAPGEKIAVLRAAMEDRWYVEGMGSDGIRRFEAQVKLEPLEG